MPYEIKDAKQFIKKIIMGAGAKNIVNTSINRVIETEIKNQKYVVVIYPIVLREANGPGVPEQRYIDINSSGWSTVLDVWRKAWLENKKTVLLAIRHVDDLIGDFLFCVEGDFGKFPNKSIYIVEEYLNDIRNNNISNYKEYFLEKHPSGRLSIVKPTYLKTFLDSYDNTISGEEFHKAFCDYTINFGDENISIVEHASKTEGKRLYYYTTKYERSAANRKAAIEKHGTICFGCGFDFGKRYGERGIGFIEIHHVKPLYEMDGESNIDPETDLIPVCSNCHRMIHKKKDEILNIAELKQIVENHKES